MPRFPQNTKAVKLALLSVVLLSMAGLSVVLLSVAGFSAYVFFDNQAIVPPPGEAQSNSPNFPELEPKKPAEAVPEKAPAAGEYLNLPAGNMKKLTELTAELRETRLEVAIKEEQAKLRRLEDSDVIPHYPPVPQVVLPAAAVPDLAGNPRPAEPRVISVQGIDGHVAATVETSSGKRTIRVGDAFAGGKVERISFEGVHIRDGQRTQLYSVED